MPKRSPSSRPDNDINKKFGVRLRVFREKGNRSQSEVGKSLGVSFQQIQKYENGTTSISLDRLGQLALFFSVPIGRLIESLEPEGSSGFAETGQAPFDAGLDQTASGADSKEAQALLKAFNRIGSRKLRRSIVTLVQAYNDYDKPDSDEFAG